MKRVYEPLNMIMNGRYAVLYRELTPFIQQEVLSRMAGLIEEERDYEDKGNYGHFCNILPTLAIDDVLQRNGKTPEEAFEMISSHMWAEGHLTNSYLGLGRGNFLDGADVPAYLAENRIISN